MTTIRQLTPADAAEAYALDTFAFVSDPTLYSVEHATSCLDWGRTFAAEHDDLPGEFAGVYSSYDLRVRIPGTADEGGTRSVPVNGLTWVAVHPDVRRRGVLRTMIRHHLESARDRGEAIAGLHASEPVIYGRFGYAVASHDVTYTLGRGTALGAPTAVTEVADRTTVRLLMDVDDDAVAARLATVDDACTTLGHVVVPESLSRLYLRDAPHARRGKEPLRALVAVRDGRDVGIAFFARKSSWDDTGNPDGTVEVQYLAATDAGAMLALGRRLVDIDLMGRTKFVGRGTDDPLLVWAGGLRQRSVMTSDALWLRPVDVGRMLATRGYAGAIDARIGVVDTTCEWNTGTWRLQADDSGAATCTRCDDEPDVRCDVDVLGEIYLGLRGPTALATAGRIEERTPGTVAALTRAFATGVQPVGGMSF